MPRYCVLGARWFAGAGRGARAGAGFADGCCGAGRGFVLGRVRSNSCEGGAGLGAGLTAGRVGAGLGWGFTGWVVTGFSGRGLTGWVVMGFSGFCGRGAGLVSGTGFKPGLLGF